MHAPHPGRALCIVNLTGCVSRQSSLCVACCLLCWLQSAAWLAALYVVTPREIKGNLFLAIFEQAHAVCPLSALWQVAGEIARAGNVIFNERWTVVVRYIFDARLFSDFLEP